MASWEKNRPAKLAACQRGGETTLERYGRSHMLRLAARRWDKRRAESAEAAGKGAAA